VAIKSWEHGPRGGRVLYDAREPVATRYCGPVMGWGERYELCYKAGAVSWEVLVEEVDCEGREVGEAWRPWKRVTDRLVRAIMAAVEERCGTPDPAGGVV
jgi:hypothetical protein